MVVVRCLSRVRDREARAAAVLIAARGGEGPIRRRTGIRRVALDGFVGGVPRSGGHALRFAIAGCDGGGLRRVTRFFFTGGGADSAIPPWPVMPGSHDNSCTDASLKWSKNH